MGSLNVSSTGKTTNSNSSDDYLEENIKFEEEEIISNAMLFENHSSENFFHFLKK